MRKAISKLCGINERTYYVWKNKSHIELIALLEEYFTEEMIYEFLENGSVISLEKENNPNNINIFMDHVKYQLRDKIRNYTDGSFFDWTNKMIPKKYLIKILKDLSQDKKKFTIENAKESILDRIKGLEVSIINKNNQKQISNFIEENLSMIECYILIQEHEEIMNYKGFWK